MKKKLIAMLLALVMVIGLVTGCGQTAPAAPAQNAEASESDAAPAVPAETEAPAVNYKKHIVIGMAAAISTADLHAANNSEIDNLIHMTHNRLVKLNIETGAFEPELATSWEWTADNVIEFKLRDDVTFHNGEKLTAKDVVFTYGRAQASGTTVATKLAGMSSIEAVDDYTVRMTLSAINVDWLYTMALEMCSILSEAAVQADEVEGPYVGTGAWVLEDFVASDYAKLTRNENYWGEKPVTEQVTLQFYPESSARLIALENGEIDVCMNPAATEYEFIEKNEDLEMITYASNTCQYLAFDTQEAPGNDVNLRLALAHCLNKDDIIAIVANGEGEHAVTNWGPATFGYYDGLTEYEYNLDLAKEYLAKAFPNGNAKLVLSTNTSAANAATATVIQEQARQIGLEVELNIVEGAALTAMSKYAKHEHEAMVYALGWSNYGDDARRPYYKDSNTNKAAIYDETMMDLIDQASQTTDEATRLDLYKQVQELNHQQAYYIPLYYKTVSQAVTKGLSGIIWNPTASHDFTYVNLAE